MRTAICLSTILLDIVIGWTVSFIIRTAIWRLIGWIVVSGIVLAIVTLRGGLRFVNLFGTAILSKILSGFKGLISRSYCYISSLDPLRFLRLVYLSYLGP